MPTTTIKFLTTHIFHPLCKKFANLSWNSPSWWKIRFLTVQRNLLECENYSKQKIASFVQCCRKGDRYDWKN